MKVLVIGDVHGTEKWKNHISKLQKGNVDSIVVLGDYVDDWNNDWVNHTQIDNMKELIEFKHKFPGKVHLLIGNHDMAYLLPENISGHQPNREVDIKEFLLANLKEFDVVVKLGPYYFSHAGISSTWMKNNDLHNINTINQCLHDKMWGCFRFNGIDMFGKDITQGPTWIRPKALITDMYYKKQVVGHTELPEGPKKIEDSGNILYVVDQPDHGAFIELEV